MLPWHARFRVPLYFRIWLAVVLARGGAHAGLRLAVAPERRAGAAARGRSCRNEAGDDPGPGDRHAADPRCRASGIEFDVPHERRQHPDPAVRRGASAGPAKARPARPWWLRGPGGLLWMLGIVAVAVALGSYPIVRRLTLRLDALARGVERWGEGDLSRARRRVRHRRGGLPGAALQPCGRAGGDTAQVAQVAAGQCVARAALAAGAHPHGAGTDGAGSRRRRSRDEITRNIAELDQLIDEILLASRLDAREADIGTDRGGGPDRPGRRGVRARRRRAECRQATAARPGGARRGQAAAPRRAQPAGERAPLQRRPGDRRAARGKATTRWCACATRDRACRRKSASASSSRSTGLRGRQRARRRRRPGPGAGARHHRSATHGIRERCEATRNWRLASDVLRMSCGIPHVIEDGRLPAPRVHQLSRIAGLGIQVSQRRPSRT